jgi:hypothetical protein
VKDSPSVTTYDWISKERFWLSCLVSPVFLAAGCTFLSYGRVGWQITGSILLLLGLLMLMRRKTIFDRHQRQLQSSHCFLGLVPIWQRTFQLDEFDAIVIERRETYHPARPHPESDTYDIFYRIGLRRKEGRPFWVRDDSFSNYQPCLRVEEFARRLARDTGLEIVEVDVSRRDEENHR